MKIAVASDDGKTIAAHLGRCRSFLIYQIENGEIKNKSKLENEFTPHALGECHDETHGHTEGHHHSHQPVLDALKDCQAVITGGMGWRFAEDLKARNIQPIMTVKRPADEAVEEYIKGKLKTSDVGFCQH